MSVVYDGVEKFMSLDDISEKKFHKVHKTAKTLFWSIFDPGHPEYVDSHPGPARISVLVMWYFYNMVTVVILLNLLIAIMNASINTVHKNSIDAWKFQRTVVNHLTCPLSQIGYQGFEYHE